MNDLLSIGELSTEEIKNIIDLSILLDNNPIKTLDNKNIIFAFEKPSLRTKVGTEVAINQLGGDVIHTTAENFYEGRILFSKKKEHSIAGRESLKDTVQNVSQWCDAIFARVFSNDTLTTIAELAPIPVVNALCDKHHPMQALADLLTINNLSGDKKVSLAYIGDANNVAFSLFEIMLKFGHSLKFAGPKDFSFSSEQENYLSGLAELHTCDISFSYDPIKAVKGTDYVYTDTFVSMGEEDVFEEKMQSFAGFQVNSSLLAHAKTDVKFMHCLPAHRGIEVTNEVMDSTASLVYQQARNRMVVSKGVFTTLLNPVYAKK